MINNTFGALLGGTTDGGQYGLESFASSLITPPNFGGSGGSSLPSSVIVALGVPGVPVICWACAPGERVVPRRRPNESAVAILIMPLLLRMIGQDKAARYPSQEAGHSASRTTVEKKYAVDQRGNHQS